MQLPYVSRRAYGLLLEQFERILKERNEQQERADRAMDQLASRFGFEPVSAPVRAEVNAATRAATQNASELASMFEDPGAGMIDDQLVDSLVGLAPTTDKVA